MRLFLGLSAGLLLSFVGSSAMASPEPILDCAAFRTVTIAPDANAAAIESAARAAYTQCTPDKKPVVFGAAQMTSLRDGRRIAKLPQMHAGLQVMDRSATVTFDAQGVAQIVAARLATNLPTDVTPAVDVTTAAATASKHAGAFADPRAGQLVIWPAGDGEHLAWSFYTPSMGLPYAPVTIVDAKTGQVLAGYNAARTVHQAQVFPSNPVKSPQRTMVTLPLPMGATMLTDELVSAKNCVDTQMTTQVLSPFGPINLHLCSLQQTAVADATTLDFGDQPAADDAREDPFAELHIYHHTRKAYDYFRAFDPAFKVQATPIDAVANLMLPAGLLMLDFQTAGNPNIPFEPFQNAFFSPAGPGSLQSTFGIMGAAMMFGQGPFKDYSYDADVIYHEFTHAAVEATVKFVGTAHRDKYGISVSPGAMNEAIADYFAATITDDPNIGEYAVLDILPNATAIRSLAGPDTCPAALAGEVHQDASLFSGGLWDVRSKVAVEIQRDFDLAVFAAMKAAPSGDLAYDEFANVIIEQVKVAPTLGAAVGTQLTDAFTKRGVLTECTRILEYQNKPMVGPLDAGDNVSVWVGPSTTTANIGGNSLGYVPGVFQVHMAVPDNVNTLEVTFRARTVNTALFGGASGEFAPKVLVRVADEPIQFKYSPFSTTPDALALDAIAGGQDGQEFTLYSAKGAIAPGAKNAYVMIVNTASVDGAFTDLNLIATQSAGTGGAGGAGAGGGGAGEAGNGGNANTPTEDSGCGCTIPGQSEAPLGFSIISLAALAGLLGRRRRT